jgi:hypothetical protein
MLGKRSDALAFSGDHCVCSYEVCNTLNNSTINIMKLLDEAGAMSPHELIEEDT